MLKNVAIVGGGPSRKQAPWSDTKWEIWTLNEAASKSGLRSEVVFQMHDPGVYKHNITRNKEGYAEDKEHWDWLQKYHGIKIYMQKVDPLVPDSVEYPIKEVNNLLEHCQVKGKNSREFEPVQMITNSASFAIALAVLQNYDHIKIYGVDMIHTEEYRYQRESFAGWVMFAAGRGIDIEIYGAESIFQRPLYGYQMVKEYVNMEFSIAERLHLLGIMPERGNLVTMKVIEEFKDKLSFSEEEIIEIELISETPDPNKPEAVVYKWNTEKGLTHLKEIEIGEATRKIMQGVFEIMDKNSTFTPPLLKLYQRFSFE